VKSSKRGEVAAVSDKASNDYFNIALDDADLEENWYIGDGSIVDYVNGISKGEQVELKFDNESVTEIRKVDGGDSGGDASGQQFVSKQDRIKHQTAFKKAVDQVDRRSCETKEDYRKMVKELTVVHGKILDEVMQE
jgi:hypothetical protein